MRTCCIIGHRNVYEKEGFKERLKEVIEDLVINNGIDTFICGSKSEFNDLCYEIVTVLKKNSPHLKLIE